MSCHATRLLLAAIFIWSTGASAQTRGQAAPVLGPLAPIRPPLSRIDMPLAPLSLPPATAIDRHVGDVRRTRPIDNERRQFHRLSRSLSSPSIIYFVPTYGWGFPYVSSISGPATAGSSYASEPPRPLTGVVHLDVQPNQELKIVVDGYYVGTWEDFNGDLELEEGGHRVEVTTSGYETLELDIRITAGRSITYRGTLRASADAKSEPEVKPAPPISPSTAPQPSTIYMIPGCYIGNVPPKDAGLPETCDLTGVRILDNLNR